MENAASELPGARQDGLMDALYTLLLLMGSVLMGSVLLIAGLIVVMGRMNDD